uniref:platelet-activating factor acetylhydrolase IB subunit n=1 Tax=Ningiella ruwaisensis TaxID=2364274 RepID=UPI001F4F4DCF|nr:platelet-activating factor acetylhydrolase IB subunit [Ningiella ruwaisensis]
MMKRFKYLVLFFMTVHLGMATIISNPVISAVNQTSDTEEKEQSANSNSAESASSLNSINSETPLSIRPSVHTAEWAVDWWLDRHKQKLQEVKDREQDIDLVFLGDSITHNWESKGKAFWQDFYKHRKALNLGFGGDRTEHLLWRLQNGAVDGISPKLVVLMIGTNNTGHRQDAAAETALGVKTILHELKTRLPDSKILLLAIFPRAESPEDELRKLNEAVNAQIRSFADNRQVFWLNINHLFVDESGMLSKDVMNDFLHPESPQYKIWAEALEPYIVRFVDKS